MIGRMFPDTDIIAHKGVLRATGLPMLIWLTCSFEIWLVSYARERVA